MFAMGAASLLPTGSGAGAGASYSTAPAVDVLGSALIGSTSFSFSSGCCAGLLDVASVDAGAGS